MPDGVLASLLLAPSVRRQWQSPAGPGRRPVAPVPVGLRLRRACMHRWIVIARRARSDRLHDAAMLSLGRGESCRVSRRRVTSARPPRASARHRRSHARTVAREERHRSAGRRPELAAGVKSQSPSTPMLPGGRPPWRYLPSGLLLHRPHTARRPGVGAQPSLSPSARSADGARPASWISLQKPWLRPK